MRIACLVRRLGPLLAVLAAASPARAYFEQTEVGARGVGMGRAYVAVAEDASAIYWNPAGLAGFRGGEVHVTHHRPYLVPGLSVNFAGVVWPVRGVPVHAAWSRFALADVTAEDLFYVGASRRVLDAREVSVALGGSLKIARVSYDGAVATGSGAPLTLSPRSEPVADVAALVRIGSRLRAAWTSRNLGGAEWDFIPGGGRTVLEPEHEAGIAYRWHEDSIVSLALVEDSGGDFTPVAGGEVTFYDVFALRIGIGDLQFFGGVGIETDRVRVDTAFSTHNTLGISSMISVNVAFGSGS